MVVEETSSCCHLSLSLSLSLSLPEFVSVSSFRALLVFRFLWSVHEWREMVVVDIGWMCDWIKGGDEGFGLDRVLGALIGPSWPGW